MVYLGVDWGRQRVGVAVSDELGRMAHPLATLEPTSRANLVDQLAVLARERGANTIVVGLPLHMNGEESDSAVAVRGLKQLLEGAGFNVVLWDERLTSREAKSLLRFPGTERIKKGRIDRAAAAILLQSFLSSRLQTE